MKPATLIAAALTVLLVACSPDRREDAPVIPPQPAAELPGQADHGFTDDGPERHLTYRPGEIEWADAPPSLERGAHVAVLEGDPGERAVFTMRIRMPDGFRIAPHSHPNVERVTVVSGTFLLGHGEVLDRNAAERLDAGSYTSIPPGTPHFAVADGETVIQLTSVGPWVIDYVDSADDPRTRD